MKKILVIEDDPKIATTLAFRLRSAGYQVISEQAGITGLTTARAEKPDLIVSDIWMPGGMGLSVAQRLDEIGLGDIPVIFITAGKQPGLREAAEDVGSVAYFEKPYDGKKLLAKIREVLREETEGQVAITE